MKLFYLITLSVLTLIISCKKSGKDVELQKEIAEFKKKRIDFNIGTTPRFFTANTISKKVFNSKDYRGKYLLLLVYEHGYFGDNPDSNYDIESDLNSIYESYKDKVSIIGIIEGYKESKKIDAETSEPQFQFDQIDNTQNPEKKTQFDTNIWCTPAKILIGPDGKVIINSCGGGAHEKLVSELEKIK